MLLSKITSCSYTRKQGDMDKLYEMIRGRNAESTTKMYMYYWKRYEEFVGDGDMFDAVNAVQWRQHMIHVDGFAASTINSRIMAIKSIIGAFYERGEIGKYVKYDFAEIARLPENALMERRRKNNRVKIEPEQMREIVEAPNPDLYSPVESRDRALLLTLATTGMRISEVLGMKTDDVQKATIGYVVKNVTGKHDRQPRTVPISAEAYEAIKDWLFIRPVQSGFIFIAADRTKSEIPSSVLWSTTQMTTTSGWRVVKKFGKKVGMPEIKPHDMRRFVGTQLAKKDIRAAQKVLGHASITTTIKYYVMDEVPEGVTEGLF